MTRSGRTCGARSSTSGARRGSNSDDHQAKLNIAFFLIYSRKPLSGAEAMASAGKKRHYADCNAVSPETTQRIGKEITRVGADYIDGAELFSLSSEPLWVWVCEA